VTLRVTPKPSERIPQPERRGVTGRSVIQEAKAKVRVIDLADLLAGPGKMRRIGAEWVGSCPLPDHEDKTPSFTVNPDKDLWFCHGCLRGGDVVRLVRYAWGYGEGEEAMAAADLLREFGHPIPSRPASWHRRQTRQARVRHAIEDAKVRRVQRRIYRWILAPPLAKIEDEDEQLEEACHAWTDAGQVARLLVARASEEVA
jgi:hypothetical protein